MLIINLIYLYFELLFKGFMKQLRSVTRTSKQRVTVGRILIHSQNKQVLHEALGSSPFHSLS